MMLVTVFTPTYNRAHLLSRLFESLRGQTFRDFEWLIVDDGSVDDTKEVVSGFINVENGFPIRYFRKENGGKHTAINFGVQKAEGKLFFIADSDDMLMPDSLKTVEEEFSAISGNDKFCGICGLDCDFQGKVIGSGLGRNYIDANSIDLRNKYNIQGDLKEVYRTEVMKEFTFPKIVGEKFCPEALVWNRIAQKYLLRCVNRPIYKVEYQDEGLTSNIVRIRMKSPVASMMTYQEMTTYNVPFMTKVKSAINYWRFYFCRKAEQHPKIKISGCWIWTMPLGWLMHCRDLASINHV